MALDRFPDLFAHRLFMFYLFLTCGRLYISWPARLSTFRRRTNTDWLIDSWRGSNGIWTTLGKSDDSWLSILTFSRCSLQLDTYKLVSLIDIFMDPSTRGVHYHAVRLSSSHASYMPVTWNIKRPSKQKQARRPARSRLRNEMRRRLKLMSSSIMFSLERTTGFCRSHIFIDRKEKAFAIVNGS